MLLNETYVNLKNQVIKAERRILKELGFCVHVKHPHKVGFQSNCFSHNLTFSFGYINMFTLQYIITVAEILGNSKNTELIQAAW